MPYVKAVHVLCKHILSYRVENKGNFIAKPGSYYRTQTYKWTARDGKNVLWHSLDSFLTKWYENENQFFTYPSSWEAILVYQIGFHAYSITTYHWPPAMMIFQIFNKRILIKMTCRFDKNEYISFKHVNIYIHIYIYVLILISI